MTDYGEPRRPPDPLLSGVDAVAAGYRTVEYVFEAFAESLRRRPEADYVRQAFQSEQGSAAPPNRLANLTVEVFDRLGEIAQEVAGGVAGYTQSGGAYPRVALKGAPGGSAQSPFTYENKGPVGLSEAKFEVTPLIGAHGRIKSGAVSFARQDDQAGAQIRPAGTVAVTVTVAIPETASPGAYRGVMSAKSEVLTGQGATEDAPDTAHTWALLELEVAAAS